ncbi:CLUMA_CG009363, isoform A [Clunio marinus]|uniref:CLUMA_CG009363, isoform A n=1 Tax=Clunio marinus TaxID=568069 RepID=A0A1J1I6J8_9DIPT|nr:CLUMA_CG009363, isoform A [Clunio marinus]
MHACVNCRSLYQVSFAQKAMIYLKRHLKYFIKFSVCNNLFDIGLLHYAICFVSISAALWWIRKSFYKEKD